MKFKYLILILLLIVNITSCKELKQLQTLTKCEFRLSNINDIKLANVKIQNISNFNQVSLPDVANLATAFASNRFPLTFNLNVDVRNPNVSAATLTALDWILFIDNIKMTQGVINQRYIIQPQGVTTIPMLLNFDLKSVLSGKSMEAVVNFALNLAGIGNKPTRLMLKAKPTINIAQIPITYPGYLSIKTDYTSK